MFQEIKPPPLRLLSPLTVWLPLSKAPLLTAAWFVETTPNKNVRIEHRGINFLNILLFRANKNW